MDSERRQFQRLNLARPLDGWFGDFSVRLLDVSATGALIDHDELIEVGARALLRFFWRSEEVEILAETLRNDDGHAGLRFVESNQTLLDFIAQSANELLIAQEANASGQRERNIIDGDATLTAASDMGRLLTQGFVTWSLVDGVWKKRPALLPDQPEEGFTLWAAEDAEQVQLLCRAYESGDADSRQMTRLLAELSVAARR